jgi:hypothetical protein
MFCKKYKHLYLQKTSLFKSQSLNKKILKKYAYTICSIPIYVAPGYRVDMWVYANYAYVDTGQYASVRGGGNKENTAEKR